MSILEDLFYSDIIPIRRSGEYDNILRYIVRHEDDLTATLTEQQKEIFVKLRDCESEAHHINEVDAFMRGFKLAVRIVMEVVPDREEMEQ